jgi:uncharacterized membrane protein SirB2
MLKHLHLFLVILVSISFLSRVFLAEFKPETLQQKWLKIGPHIIDSLLLLSGIALIVQGNWLAGDYDWLLAKIALVIVYIGLGMLAMRQQNPSRWLISTAAIACLLLIGKIAVSKKIFLFF